MKIGLFKTIRYKIHAVSGFLGGDGRFRQRLHFDEPLRGQIRLDHGAGTFAMSDLMHMVFNFNQNAQLLQVLDDLFAALGAVHPLVLARVLIHFAAFVHDGDLRQLMT
ncbi:hypothetical protein D1872_249200 [compost metagenome]